MPTARHTSAVRSAFSLPAALEIGDLLSTVRARLALLTDGALPAACAECSRLTLSWYSEAADAVLLHIGESGYAIPLHAAGADSVAVAFADVDALTREAAALRDLLDALEDYDGGGRLTRAAIEEDPQRCVNFARTRPAASATHA